MGIKPIPMSLFLQYLRSIGLEHIRTEASHFIWDYPDGKKKLYRPLVIRKKDKDIPLFHIHTNLLTIGKSKADFELWIKMPRKQKKNKMRDSMPKKH